MLSIYIHIPFCIKKCLYCDFLSFEADNAVKDEYIHALLLEIEKESSHYLNSKVDTVFIGGGTPSLLPAVYIEKILDKLREYYRFVECSEITIEVNPGTVDMAKLMAYKEAGINRLSIGTQSVQDDELKALGRIHSAGDFFETFGNARKAGFTNINVDLMSALPGQTTDKYTETLRIVTDLEPEHISAYSLIIEEGTPFYDLYGEESSALKSKPPLPSEEEERLMYEKTEDFLKQRDYHRYEISNYARKGKECRHNTAYWRRHNYAGFGLGASSMVSNVRWKNTSDINEYINNTKKNIKCEIQHLDVEEQMEEFMFLGLRMTDGVSKQEFVHTFNRSMDEVYGKVLIKLYEQELIEVSERVKLTPFGRDISNYVMAQFIF